MGNGIQKMNVRRMKCEKKKSKEERDDGKWRRKIKKKKEHDDMNREKNMKIEVSSINKLIKK